MRCYGSVNGFVYCARQRESPKPEPEPEPEMPAPKPKDGPTKECSGCGRSLPLDCFYRRKSNKDGFSRYCMACACNNQRYKLKRAKLREESKDKNERTE